MGSARRRTGKAPSSSDYNYVQDQGRFLGVRSHWWILPACTTLAAVSFAAAIVLFRHLAGHPRFYSDLVGKHWKTLDDKAAAADEVFRLHSIFAPPRIGGNFRIDADSAAFLERVSRIAPKESSKIQEQLEDNPLQMGGRLGLCNALEKFGRNGRIRDELYSELALCYRRFMEAFSFASSLEHADPRRQLLDMEPTAGRVAGARMLTYMDGRSERLQEAIQYLQVGVSRHKECTPRDECVAAWAELLLAMRLRGDSHAEVERARQSAQSALGSAISWPDAWSVHLQLPGIRHSGFWDAAAIPWLAEVATQWREARAELDQYLSAREESGSGVTWERHPESAFLANATAWNSVELAMRGKWREDICKRSFPVTCSLLRDRAELDPSNFRWPDAALGPPPGGPGGRGPPVLMVNIYQAAPGARVRAHFGTHGRLVASLGLRVPSGSVLRVGAETRQWKEGEWLLFDDSYEHEVVNDGIDHRYVLAVALLHPDCCHGCSSQYG